MIDFRYHLVSIVSIFLALAVGILLGAGPLKEDIGNRLTEQTAVLRAEKTKLRTDLDDQKRGTSARDNFATAVAPAIMKDRLTGKTVALVIAPGTDSDLVKSTAASLVTAGARVGSTVTLADGWADPANLTVRDKVINQLAGLDKTPLGATSPDQAAARVLARAILSGTNQPTARQGAASTATLEALKAGDLVKVTPEQILPSSSVVFLGGPVQGSTQQETAGRLSAFLQLARSLDAGASGAVVATLTKATEGANSADLVTAVRKDPDAVKGLSTVDDADLPMGQATLVLALAQQYAGSGGHYGLAADATAIAPDTTEKQ